MPMKTTADIPVNMRIVCEWRLAEAISFIFTDNLGPFLDMGGLDIVPRPKEANLYQADNIVAAHGWGPFLVDVAMEWVTEKGGFLYPHHKSIMPEAKLMWASYLSMRPEVRHHPLANNEAAALGIVHEESELRCLYSKQPTLLQQLRVTNRFEDRTHLGYQPPLIPMSLSQPPPPGIPHSK